VFGHSSELFPRAIFSDFQQIHGAPHEQPRHSARTMFLQAILDDNAVVIIAELFLELIRSIDDPRHAFARYGLSELQ
jgi:hypothetical protein